MSEEVQLYIDNTEALMNDIGDEHISGTEVATVLEDYKKIAVDWDDFLNSHVRSNGGDPATLSSEQGKIDFIREHTFYGGQNEFLTELHNKVNNRNKDRDILKDKAENILREQQKLIEKNKKAIEELNKDLIADFEKKEKLEKKISEINDKLSDLRSDPTKNKDAIEEEEKKLSSKKAKLKSLIGNDGKALDNRKAKIKELTDKNKDLKKHLEKNYKEMDAVFSKDGIKIQNPSVSVEEKAPQQPSSPGEDTQAQNNQEKAKGGASVADATQPSTDSSQNQLKKLTDKEIAMNMAREFRKAKTPAERAAMIDGYGYTDLIAMLDRVGIFERRRITPLLEEARDYLKPPKSKIQFLLNMDLITGDRDLASKCYSLLFENDKMRDFKKLSVEELRDIRRVMDLANERRAEIGKNNLEALEYFDKNFAKFAKAGSLVERANTGWIKSFFADMVKGQQKAARDNVAGSMRDYAMQIQDENVKKIEYENKLRAELGQEVKEVPDPINENRGYSRHESLQQDIDRRSQQTGPQPR